MRSNAETFIRLMHRSLEFDLAQMVLCVLYAIDRRIDFASSTIPTLIELHLCGVS